MLLTVEFPCDKMLLTVEFCLEKGVKMLNLNVSFIDKSLAVKGLTQKRLAEMAGLYRQNISAILKKGSCTPITAGKIAAALNVNIDEIIKSEGGNESG